MTITEDNSRPHTRWRSSTVPPNEGNYESDIKRFLAFLTQRRYISAPSLTDTDYVGADNTGFVKMSSRDRPSVDVTIPVEPEVAAALRDARNRQAVGRLVSRVLRPRAGPNPLAQAIAEMKAEARAAGLTDADIDAELAVYNAERRDAGAVD
jgi:hypothetical protein